MTKKWYVRGLALLLAVLLPVSLAACKAKPVEEEESSTPAAQESSVVEEESVQVSEAEESAEPEPTPEPTPTNINMLTGLPTLTEEAIGKRPVAVMINNARGALPQNGVGSADILFEIPVEGDETRLMGVFGDYTQLPTIGSVRSCRYYFPILALSFDAFYVNWGMDPTIATETVARLDIDQFDGIRVGFGFGRDQERLNNGVSLEHTAMLYGEKFPELLEKYESRTELKDEWKNGMFTFADAEEPVVPAGDKADFIKIEFGAQTSRFTYNAETHVYEKLYGKNPHIDNLTGEQISFTNVIVMETDISTRDTTGRKNVNWQGGEEYTGWYFTEGARQPITWSKADEYSKIEFFDETGAPLTMNCGKTYIAVVYRDRVSLENDLG